MPFEKGNKLGVRFQKGDKNPGWKGGDVKLHCIICGKVFEVSPNREKVAIYCSHKCRGAGREKLKGRLHYEIKIKNKGWFTSERVKGKNNINWNGGITSEQDKIRHTKELCLWRKAVFARDNWTCQKCGQQSGMLNAHHKKSFVKYLELRTSIENGITLCKKCHNLIHYKIK